MGRWKLAFGLALALVAGALYIGLSGRHASPPAGSAAKSPISAPGSPSSSSVVVPPGVITPKGVPEFSATFTRSRLDTSLWATCYPQMDEPTGCRNFGNREFEWYMPSQDQVYDGALHLVAQPESTPGKTASGSPEDYSCRSGMVTTYPGFTFKYGYIQVVARIPAAAGLWPALWLEAANLKWPPEMDMVESWGQNDYASAYFHPAPRGTPQVHGIISPPTRATGWHTFALSWTKTQMTWLLDGKTILTVHHLIPHEKMFFIADLAEYKPVQSGTTRCNGTMLIRSVTVWKG